MERRRRDDAAARGVVCSGESRNRPSGSALIRRGALSLAAAGGTLQSGCTLQSGRKLQSGGRGASLGRQRGELGGGSSSGRTPGPLPRPGEGQALVNNTWALKQ